MCGRYVSAADPAAIAAQFDVEKLKVPEDDTRANYNVAPTTNVPVVVDEHDPDVDGGITRVLEPMRWGLLPHWAKDMKAGARMINARAETIATKNAYRNAFKGRRCIIPADGFYEWRREEGSKQPFFIHRNDGRMLAFAGLWETWHDKQISKASEDAPEVVTCSIVTTTANEFMSAIHDRMPVILPEDTWELWLDPDLHDTDVLQRLLVPAAEDVLEMWPVDRAVGSVRNNSPDLLEPVAVP